MALKLKGVNITRNNVIESVDALIGKRCNMIFHVSGIGFGLSQLDIHTATNWTEMDIFEKISDTLKQSLAENCKVEKITLISITQKT